MDQLAQKEPAPIPDAEARATYLAGIRRSRFVYAGVILAILVALGVTVGVAYSRGEIAHTTLHTVRTAPADVGIQTPADTVAKAWSSTDATATGTPYWKGTVVTFDQHTVRGRAATTGAQTWSYTRSDRTVCAAVQTGGATIAIYRLAGNCDEVTALDSSTGKRLWTRTLDMNAMPVNGTPTVQVADSTLLVTTPSVIYAIATTDPNGLDRWEFSRPGCTIQHAVMGSSGALISMTCDSQVQCTGLTYCGTGPQLLLRDAYGSTDSTSKTNPDRIQWDVKGQSLTPVSSDSQVLALNSAHELVVLDAKTGKQSSVVRGVTGGSTVSATPVGTSELIWTGGRTYAVANSALSWAIDTSTLPTATSLSASANGTVPSDLSSGLLVATLGTDDIAILNGDRGVPSRLIPVQGLALGATAYPYGSGFLVAGTSTTVYR